MRSDLDISILSAEHGLLDTSEEITYYDRRMDTARAQELNDAVLESLVDQIEKSNYDRIILNMGETYQTAITGLSGEIDLPVVAITGSGIGEKGHHLYEFIRGDDSVVSELTDV